MVKRVVRFGQTIDVDEVFEAWNSSDIDRMRAALGLSTNGVERHYLLSALVQQLYERRASSPAARQELFAVGATHLREMPELLAALRADRIAQRERNLRRLAQRAARRGEEPIKLPPLDPDFMVGIPTFGALETAHCEAGDWEAAREVWRYARRVGYLRDDDHLARRLEGIERHRGNSDRA